MRGKATLTKSSMSKLELGLEPSTSKVGDEEFAVHY